MRADKVDIMGNRELETSKFRILHDAEDGCFDPMLLSYGNPGVGECFLS